MGMIGYCVTMWFVSAILLYVSRQLLRGSIHGMHGRTFAQASDKPGFAIP